MNQEQKLKAFLANEAYKKEPTKSYQGYTLVHSDPFTKVYRNPVTKKQLTSIRGTDSFADGLLDVQLSLGKNIRNSDRYKRSEEVAKKFFDPGFDNEFVGHSMGSMVADQLAQRFGTKSTGFNPYTSNRALQSTNTTIIRTADDPLAAASRLGGNQIAESLAKEVITLPAVGKGPLAGHSIESFL